MIKEPKRLIESDSGPLAESLAASQLRVPSDTRMAALAARLASAGVLVGDAAHAPALREPPRVSALSQLPAKSLESSLKLALGAVAISVVALGGAVYWRYGVPRAATSVVLAQNAANASANAGTPASDFEPPLAARSTPAIGDVQAALSVPRADAPSATAVAPAPEATPEEAPPPAGGDSGETRPNAPATVGTNSVAGAAPRPRAAEPEAKRAVTSATTPRSDAASSGERLPLPANTVIDSEVEMLKKARNALSVDPVQAYALTERCRAQYPSGAFAQERDFIAISSLVRLGRRDEARGRASLFRTRYRNSAYLPQLTRMLGEE